MRTLNEILVEMKALVEELETHIGKPKTDDNDIMISFEDQYVLAGAMDDNMAFNFAAAQPTLHVDDTISLSEINISAR
jgi:hypothetical protein